jgi:AraC-like DNA-binding protein
MGQDTLSEVLRCVRLRGALFYYVSYGPAWAAEVPASRLFASAVLPGAEHVMEYHVLTKGEAWAAVAGGTPVRVGAGDIVMFPHGDAHVMSSAPDLRPQPVAVDWIYATRNDPKPIAVSYGDVIESRGARPADHAAANVVCGFLGCDLRPFNPLIATLPRLLHLPAAGDGEWVARVMRQAVQESQQRRPGGEAVLERLSEMMFVDSLRRHLERLPEGSTGWLAGLRDRLVGKALGLLHDKPADPWTIEALSARVGLSRSALHERFVHFIGQAPMQYLGQWRMQVAARLLHQSHANVASIALDVGYESEAAFSRAFKRAVGMPPAAWRKRQRAAPAAELQS